MVNTPVFQKLPGIGCGVFGPPSEATSMLMPNVVKCVLRAVIKRV